jgi:transposase
MASTAPNQYPVILSGEQRERLQDICRNGHASAKKIRHAQVLLLSDHHRPEGRLTGERIAETLGMHINSVARIRKRFALEGESPALERKQREAPPTQPIIDGHAEAHLVAICCSDPPDGRVCWTMQMLADALIKRRVVIQVSAETVRRALKKRAPAMA